MSGGWQPIETAPKMKTVLLFADTSTPGMSNWRVATGYWHTGYEGEEDVTPWCWEGHQLRHWERQPTHWMPLPEAPAQS